jgi:hypothetical protein
VICTGASPAIAHGFGQRYELPLPLAFYLFGGAAAVALSFVVFGLFAGRGAGRAPHPHRDLLARPVGRALAHPLVVLGVRLLGVGLFALIVLAGFLGEQNPYRNIAPTLVWVVWWVGLTFVSAFVGNIWVLLNPWNTLFAWAERLWGRMTGRPDLSLRLAYPRGLGGWPACILFLAFAWTELIDPEAAVPLHIAQLAVAYSVLTLSGMALFGREVWLKNGEVFSIAFGLFARFAPTQARNGRLLVRLFGQGLLEDSAVSTSTMAFVLLVLATVLYDGLIATPEWSSFETSLRGLLPDIGPHPSLQIRTVGLLAAWLAFLAAYLAVSAFMTRLAGQGSPLSTARGFALTLMPIALGYHVAHYLVFLLIQGQYIVPLASDPFGRGWDLFGTAGYRIDIGLVGARFAWYAMLTAIVVGHVTAVYLAHLQAMRVYGKHGTALASQAPLTALMVLYTFIGLSIAAEPIVEQRTPAAPTAVRENGIPVAADAVSPEARTGMLRAVGPGRSATVKLTYSVLGSAFHDGTKTSIADLLYAYAFAYRWADRDAFIARATAPMREHLVAVRATAVDAASKSFRVADVTFVREIFTVEVYLAIAPDDLEWNGAIAPPWSTVPWHVLVLMEEAVKRNWAALSHEQAQRHGSDWLDLVRAKELIQKLAELAATFEREGYRPEALRAYVSEDEARRRWAALGKFHAAHGHLLVTNGPYRLKGWSNDSVTLEAFRDLTYPLGVGSYDAYAVPRRGFVTGWAQRGSRLVLEGEIETLEKFQRSYRLVRAPLKALGSDIVRRSAPECRYTVVDEKGAVLAAGAAPLGAGATFEIDFAGRLPPGSYVLFAVIAVNSNMANADVRRIPLVVAPDR